MPIDKSIGLMIDTCVCLLPSCFLRPWQVDVESSASLDAFARLAPGIPLVADSITVHALFELLTADGQTGRMPFAVYNKYLNELDK